MSKIEITAEIYPIIETAKALLQRRDSSCDESSIKQRLEELRQERAGVLDSEDPSQERAAKNRRLLDEIEVLEYDLSNLWKKRALLSREAQGFLTLAQEPVVLWAARFYNGRLAPVMNPILESLAATLKGVGGDLERARAVHEQTAREIAHQKPGVASAAAFFREVEGYFKTSPNVHQGFPLNANREAAEKWLLDVQAVFAHVSLIARLPLRAAQIQEGDA